METRWTGAWACHVEGGSLSGQELDSLPTNGHRAEMAKHCKTAWCECFDVGSGEQQNRSRVESGCARHGLVQGEVTPPTNRFEEIST